MDADQYAAEFNVSVADARQFLSYQDAVSALDRHLLATGPEYYGGTFISNGPRYTITFNVVKQGRFGQRRAEINKMIKGKPWRKFARVRYVEHSVATLSDAQRNFDHLMDGSEMDYDSMLDVADNDVAVMVTDQSAFEALLVERGTMLPEGLRLEQVDALSEPEITVAGGQRANLVGGGACTTGFAARDEFGRNGILTAAHCAKDIRLSDGTVLPIRVRSYQGSRDVQWHLAVSGVSVSPSFFDGTSFRFVDRATSSFEQSVGSYACTYGSFSGYACGTIESKSYRPSYVPSGTASFVYVDGGSTDLSVGGDSGGPWFLGNKAYGIHSGGAGNDAIYMPIDRILGLGLSVIEGQ